MRFLSVADRELRAAARQKATYRTRWITAVLFFLLLSWLLWVFHRLPGRRAALEIFNVYSVLTFLYCLFLGAVRTADCISAERREGTLGLLFLTNLNSGEIIAGKLCSTALASVYGLMAIFPMLALPLLMGGITFDHFGRMVLALLNGIGFALAVGFLASVTCKRQATATTLGLGLTILVAGGVMLAAAAADSYPPTRWLTQWVAIWSPFYALITADSLHAMRPNLYWLSLGAVSCLSLTCLGLTTWLLARTWRDRPKGVPIWRRLKVWQRTERAPSARRAAFRRRLLAINPMFWLAGREPVSAPVLMVLALLLTWITVYVAAPFFGSVMGGGGAGRPVLGLLFAWLWTAVTIHVLVLYYAALVAAQRLAEDRQTGALELLLSTPTSERTISRGLWLAYGRKMLFPALLAVLSHLYFIWTCMVMATLEPPGPLPSGATAGEIFWGALWNQPIRGQVLDWHFGFLLRIGLLLLVLVMVVWVTLGWVGRWLGLRLKHPGFAPMAALALISAPPVLLFSFVCYLADEFNFDRLPERQFLPLMMWLGMAIGLGHCLLLSLWASRCLRRLRAVAMSRYEPLPRWRWRLPRWRTVRRAALGAAAFGTALVLLVVVYYGYQNGRSRLAWRRFQTSLAQRGETLSLAARLPEPVPDSANFARSPAFLSLLSRTNAQAAGWLAKTWPHLLTADRSMTATILMDWSRQSPAPLQPFTSSGRNQALQPRRESARVLLQELQLCQTPLNELAAAARLPAFQVLTNRDAGAVFRCPWEPIRLLESVHLLYQWRACAELELGQNAEAAQDVLTGLALARLARQLPDPHATGRVQALLARCLQPLWEGLRQSAWTEPQLAALQRELAGFNLLADYTNALNRLALAHIEVWRTIPDHPSPREVLNTIPAAAERDLAWHLQPRAWWFQSCIQLYDASRNSIAQVEVANGRVRSGSSWSDLEGLPLDTPSNEAFQQILWWSWRTNPALLPFAQTAVNQALIACALERFRLARQSYPETLDQLVPAFLETVPRDAVTGRPMIYQRLQPNRFHLRGVGPNGNDDHAKPGSDDWSWSYTTNAPSVKK